MNISLLPDLEFVPNLLASSSRSSSSAASSAAAANMASNGTSGNDATQFRENALFDPPASTNFTTSTEGLGDGHIMDTAPQWIFLCLAIVPIWVIFGNFLVLMAVVCNRSLRTLSNYVIASLAFTDLMLALIVVPFGIYQIVNQTWELGLYVCLLWTGCDVFLSTTSILHLSAIAIHRYYGIAHPLRVRSTQETRHVTLLLLPTWTVSFAISLPLIIQGAFYDSSAVFITVPNVGPQCGIFDNTFAIYSSMVSYFIPLAVMVFADLRSVQILRNNVRMMVTQKNGGGCGVGSSGGGTSGGRSPMQNLTSPSNNCGTGAISAADHRARNNHHNQINKDTSFYELTPEDSVSTALASTAGASSPMERSNTHNNVIAVSETSLVEFTPHSTPSSERRLNLRITSRPLTKGFNRNRSKSMGYIGMLATRGMVKLNSRERRAEKTLIWVFACFVVFWLPFFTTNLTYGICRGNCDIPENVFLAFTWLGYISSGVNPCIYTLLNKDFRNAFKKILFCHHFRVTRKAPSYA